MRQVSLRFHALCRWRGSDVRYLPCIVKVLHEGVLLHAVRHDDIEGVWVREVEGTVDALGSEMEELRGYGRIKNQPSRSRTLRTPRYA